MSTPKMRQVIVRMAPTYHDEVKETAASLGISVAELVRIAVSHWYVCDDGEKTLRRRIAHRVLAKKPSEHPDDYEERLAAVAEILS